MKRRKRLVIMRGLPGSGKSTMARDIARSAIKENHQEVVICSTDSFFVNDDGEYVFDPTKLGQHHSANQHKVKSYMLLGAEVIIVDNTNTTHREMKPYKELALLRGYDVHEVFIGKEFLFQGMDTDHNKFRDYIALCHERGTHGVPMESIEKMARRFQE